MPILRKSLSALRSPKGRDVLLYLGFCLVAFVFWVLLSLDTEVQRDYDVPVVLENVPDSVTLLRPTPQSVAVSVKAKDSQLLRFRWGRPGAVRFKWDDINLDGELYITRSAMDTKLREYFGGGVRIITMRPDSIRSAYTVMPPRRVPVEVITDIHTGLQYTLSGPIRANVDSVDVYAPADSPADITYVQTEVLFKTGLRDTSRFELRVKPIKGVRIIPDRVVVTVPVEPLISRRRSIPVEVLNAPAGSNVVTFPSKVDIDYLVPMSKYAEDYPVKAFADYAGRSSGKAPVILSDMPAAYRSASVKPDSVEYIIEELSNGDQPATPARAAGAAHRNNRRHR